MPAIVGRLDRLDRLDRAARAQQGAGVRDARTTPQPAARPVLRPGSALRRRGRASASASADCSAVQDVSLTLAPGEVRRRSSAPTAPARRPSSTRSPASRAGRRSRAASSSTATGASARSGRPDAGRAASAGPSSTPSSSPSCRWRRTCSSSTAGRPGLDRRRAHRLLASVGLAGVGHRHPATSPSARRSGSTWPGRSPSHPACSSSTSRSAAWTPRSARVPRLPHPAAARGRRLRGHHRPRPRRPLRRRRPGRRLRLRPADRRGDAGHDPARPDRAQLLPRRGGPRGPGRPARRTTTGTVLALDDVSHHYGGVRALEDLSLSVAKGAVARRRRHQRRRQEHARPDPARLAQAERRAPGRRTRASASSRRAVRCSRRCRSARTSRWRRTPAASGAPGRAAGSTELTDVAARARPDPDGASRPARCPAASSSWWRSPGR